MKRNVVSILLIVLIIFSLLLGGLVITVAVAGSGTLAFDKELVSWVVGSEPSPKSFTVQMNITDVQNLVGLVFSFHWDPTYLNLTNVLFTSDCVFGTAAVPAPDGTGGTILVPAAGQWKTITHFSDGNFSQQAYGELPTYVTVNFTSPTWGKVVTLNFTYIGPAPSIGSPVDTDIVIVNHDYACPTYKMATQWVKLTSPPTGVTSTIFNVLGSTHFHYESALKAVHLESGEDTGASTNLGTITFDGVSYSLPNDISKAARTYQAQYFAGVGYLFDHWQTIGMVSVSDVNANPVTVIVSGDGTLKAVYREVTVAYMVHLESGEDTGASVNLGTISFDNVSCSLPNDVSKTVGTYRAQYFADAIIHMFYHWETAGLVSVSDAYANPATVTVSGNGTLKAIYASHHINHFNDNYVPMVIPVNDKNLTIAPVINCTILENSVFKSFYYPCKSAQTTLTDDDWSDGDANYTYVFEDWVDYDWNDIVVSLYAITNDTIDIRAYAHLDSREAAWKNPFSVEITPMGMNVLVYWNSTDYREEHIVQVNSSVTQPIELFFESNPEDIAFIKIIPIIPPTYTLTITSTSGGTTDPVPGTYSYDEGTVVSVTAVPDSSYIFDHWELDGDVRSANPIDVTMDANHTLHAVFAEITYTLTITTTTGGTTIPSPGDHVYSFGTNVHVTTTPQSGYQFDHWELDGIGVGSANPYTVTMNADHNLHAIFKAVPPVGGHAIPIDKTHFLAPSIGLIPRIGLASVLLVAMAVTVILIRRKKRH